jgi:hypothetical protein
VVATARIAKGRSLAGRSRACRQECRSHAIDKHSWSGAYSKETDGTRYGGKWRLLDVGKRMSRRSGVCCWHAMCSGPAGGTDMFHAVRSTSAGLM